MFAYLQRHGTPDAEAAGTKVLPWFGFRGLGREFLGRHEMSYLWSMNFRNIWLFGISRYRGIRIDGSITKFSGKRISNFVHMVQFYAGSVV